MKCCFCIFENIRSLFKSMLSKEDDIDNVLIDIDNEVIK